ncbi:hypothetical protein HX13_12390 [Chryseobacterium sp. P1-3]|uniref:Uncharacterized protein n=1 Tax=Chryseobacterium gallinarum TaxID=1324352 RepID=A0A0G3M5R1_CHRGL|nr:MULTISPECIES: hypothetical protein [Chryseobacterium]AKK73960.1 hypothetical protein OK18_16335 [Chryseobacterium gallinarum]KFF74803.1 hypothetical protein HX13_12390 [Chryseobacterium sp. P1-3]MCL8537765.1 hypothetical protein [Chryseobacterium gallinarum]
MDEVKTELLNPITDKYLIDEYFNLIVKKELDTDIDFAFEYIITQNIVSKKLILVKTFSDFILDNPQLYILLSSLIYKINTRSLSKNQIITELENLRKNH